MRISDWSSDVCSSDLRVSLWGKRGESLQPYLLKGVKVAISGEFETSEYEGKTKLNIRDNEVDIMSSRKDQNESCGNRNRDGMGGNSQNGRAHVCTPVTNSHLACRRLLENTQDKTQ